MTYCEVCDFAPGSCGFDPAVCDAIQMYSSGGGAGMNIKVLGITTEVAVHDGVCGYTTDYYSKEFRRFKTKKEAVRFIKELCDKNGIR
jgi:hypothetical protein